MMENQPHRSPGDSKNIFEETVTLTDKSSPYTDEVPSLSPDDAHELWNKINNASDLPTDYVLLKQKEVEEQSRIDLKNLYKELTPEQKALSETLQESLKADDMEIKIKQTEIQDAIERNGMGFNEEVDKLTTELGLLKKERGAKMIQIIDLLEETTDFSPLEEEESGRVKRRAELDLIP